jgi:hypothetical protein
MFNIVEMMADEGEQQEAPCKWGNIVEGHACYCHNDAWKEGPRKCPIYRNFELDPAKWIQREWEEIELPMHRPELPGGVRMEMVPCMPDDDAGGCPKFEARAPHSGRND